MLAARACERIGRLPRTSSYDESSWDAARLEKYARRVARETQVPLRPPIAIVREESRPRPSSTEAPRKASFIDRLFGKGAKSAGPSASSGPLMRTIEVLPEHWLIDERYHRINTTVRFNSPAGRREENFIENFYLVLTREGRLMEAVIRKEENHVLYAQGPGNRWTEGPDFQVRTATQESILRLDRSKQFRMRRVPGGTAEGTNRFNGRVFRHAKGVGINLALKDLLEGRDPTMHTTKVHYPNR